MELRKEGWEIMVSERTLAEQKEKALPCTINNRVHPSSQSRTSCRQEKKTARADGHNPAPGAWGGCLAVPDMDSGGVSGSQAPDLTEWPCRLGWEASPRPGSDPVPSQGCPARAVDVSQSNSTHQRVLPTAGCEAKLGVKNEKLGPSASVSLRGTGK